MTGSDQAPRDGAEALRQRLGQALAERALLRTLTIVLAFAGPILLAVRLSMPAIGRNGLLAGLTAALAVGWIVGRLRAARQTPSYVKCLAAVDAASKGGGLLMSGDVARSAGWHPEAARLTVPDVTYRPGHAIWPPLLLLAFIVAVLIPPPTIFARAFPPSRADGIRALLDEEAQRLERYREQEIVDDETADRIHEWLESANAAEERSAGELLEVLDQVADELDRAAEETAKAGLFSTLSNLLASASSGALSPEMLSALSNGLANASAAATDRLRQLTEADVQQLAKCNGGNGSCTNAAAALAELLARDADCAACAAALSAMCSESGEGDIGKGYMRSELTWRDPVSADGTESKETSLGAGMRTGDDAPRLISVSTSAPHDDGKADVTPGQLGNDKGAAGDARTPIVLPRHREAVRKYLGDGK